MSSLAQIRTIRPDAEIRSGPSPFFTVRLLRAFAHFAETHGWQLFAAISAACGWVRVHTLATSNLGAKLRVVGTCADTSEECQIYEIRLPNTPCPQP